MKYEGGSMKGCTCISLSKKKVQHFNLHNSNFILAFDSLQPNSLQPVFLPFLPGLPVRKAYDG
jgi:hypothetical protein